MSFIDFFVDDEDGELFADVGVLQCPNRATSKKPTTSSIRCVVRILGREVGRGSEILSLDQSLLARKAL